MIKQFIKFTGVGAIGTSAHYLTLIIFVHIFNVNPIASSTIGYIVGAIVNYHLNYHFTFNSNKNHREAMLKFFIVAGIGLFLNGLIMQSLISFFSIPYFYAQMISTGLILMWNFLINRIWTFKEKQQL